MFQARSVSKIRELGANSDVFKVELPKKTVVLKKAYKKTSDNLSFENMAGMAINAFNDDLFVKTYGIYYGIGSRIDVDFVRRLKLLPTKSPTCDVNENRFLVTEYFKGKDAMLLMKENKHKFIARLPYALFLMYRSLSRLKTQFTHYDLHLGNVLFDEAGNPKLIDFGRCYFKGADQYKNHVCSVCFRCGEYDGYWYQPDGKSRSVNQDFFIDPSAPNQSHDLLYLVKLKHYYGSEIKELNPTLYAFISNVVYLTKSGTPEIQSDGIRICNVTDAAEALQRMISTSARKTSRRSFVVSSRGTTKRPSSSRFRWTRFSGGRTAQRRGGRARR
jgi:serine/threonine protein kinase